MMGPARPDPLEIERIFRAKEEWHRKQAKLPPVEKVRILLRLQRDDYPLIQKHRRLEAWERPWDVDP